MRLYFKGIVLIACLAEEFSTKHISQSSCTAVGFRLCTGRRGAPRHAHPEDPGTSSPRLLHPVTLPVYCSRRKGPVTNHVVALESVHSEVTPATPGDIPWWRLAVLPCVQKYQTDGKHTDKYFLRNINQKQKSF